MENNCGIKKKRFNKITTFIICISFIYFVVAIVDFSIAKNATVNFLKMFAKILPILGVVLIFMTVINFYFTKERTEKYLGHESGFMGWIYAIISGILITGPPYVIYPLLGSLKQNGMKNSLLAVLLYNRNVKIPFIPVMIYYFGLKFTIIISFYILLFSVINGKAVELLT